jgi:competence protein ComEC
MPSYDVYFWKKAPFVRLLISMIAGILVQWQFPVSIRIWWLLLSISIIAVTSFFFIPFFHRFRLGFLGGIACAILFISIGALWVWHRDIRNQTNWLGTFYRENDALAVTLNEPPVEKAKSFKVNATVSYLLKENNSIRVAGNIIVYFKKDPPEETNRSLLQELHYGTVILFKKALQEIKNSGNPGAFDYKRFSLFRGITHQVYLEPDEFVVLTDKKENWLDRFIYSCRNRVLNILRKNIPGSRERGLAEALLIGYKDDLDPGLVQSYTHTGVVHIIAISGLHIGLIYWLLVQLLRPMQRSQKIKWLRPFFIIVGLWLFSLLAGAQPSVLRSALMFTCIVLAENLAKKTSVYNTLALSAFLLLCYNPFWLWDAGFQLSYAAVLSIIIFRRPVYNWFYFENKLLDLVWKLNAVTIAAQILTVPLSIYHFHQFPNYFILTNLVAVPLSSIIVLGEILLCVIYFIPAFALLVGKLLTILIGWMNQYIERIERMPFSLWNNLQVNGAQTVLLILFITGASYWLMERSAGGLKTALIALLGFAAFRSCSFISAGRQRKIIVYNIPQQAGIDFIEGRKYFFAGDSSLLEDDVAGNFYVKPSRTMHRLGPAAALPDLFMDENYINYHGKNILLYNKPVLFARPQNKPVIDLMLVSKNPKIFFYRLSASLDIKQVVFDGSVPEWRRRRWKEDCDSLHIPCHDVTVNGAFVMNLN